MQLPLGLQRRFWKHRDDRDREPKRLHPSSPNRAQPTAFKPGQNDNVFVVTWNGVGSLTWSLNGHDVAATTTSTACAQNLVPIVGPQTVLWGVAIVAYGGAVVLR